ncbi:DUF3558 domain-containing protein [Amycolatopsis sp. NEAU-NG30]|uniref:DUF3558 domain-containing protein n=1 Tax=Amycolatopsis melonis TaxID=3156488 RepID=A0ABV0LLI5_9PSEU
MRRAILLISGSLLVLTACTPKNDGSPLASAPTPSQASPSGSTDQVPGPGVPKVENPIDITHFQQTPCDSLTPNQIEELLGSGITPKPEPDSQAGPSCSWNAADSSQAGVHVIFANVDKLGLTSVYRAKGTTYPFFEPLDPIDGYPLVAYDGEGDQSAKGRCTVAMGTSDTQAVDISIAQSEEKVGKRNPCAAARDVAAKVLGNLKAGK